MPILDNQLPPPGRFRAVIFDFDGLILDTETPIFRSWEEFYLQYGGELSFSSWETILGTVSNELDQFEDLEAQIGYTLDHEALSPLRRQREDELIAEQPIQPGVQAYLEDAHRMGLKIGLASSSPCDWVTGHLSRLGLIHYFDCIRARDDVQNVKPDPELYLAVLKSLGMDPHQAVVLEDSPIGVSAARAAGIYCVAVPNSLTRLMPLQHANLVLDSLADLPLRELLRKASQDGVP